MYIKKRFCNIFIETMHMQMFCVNMTFKNALFFPVHFGCGIVFVYRGWERALQWEPAIAQPPRGP